MSPDGDSLLLTGTSGYLHVLTLKVGSGKACSHNVQQTPDMLLLAFGFRELVFTQPQQTPTAISHQTNTTQQLMCVCELVLKPYLRYLRKVKLHYISEVFPYFEDLSQICYSVEAILFPGNVTR